LINLERRVGGRKEDENKRFFLWLKETLKEELILEEKNIEKNGRVKSVFWYKTEIEVDGEVYKV